MVALALLVWLPETLAVPVSTSMHPALNGSAWLQSAAGFGRGSVLVIVVLSVAVLLCVWTKKPAAPTVAEQLHYEADSSEPPLPKAIDGVPVKVPDSPRFAEVRQQLRKISTEVQRITASWMAIRDNGALPGEDRDTVHRATLDAIGTLHTSVEELKRQVEETERNSYDWNREENVAPIKKKLAKREASLTAAIAAAGKRDPDGTATAELTGLSEAEVRALFVSSLHPDYVEAGDESRPTVQRVIGALVVAGGLSAKLEAAMRSYHEKRTEAAADAVPKIIDDVERYAAAVTDLMVAPDATDAIAKLKRLKELIRPDAEANAADKVANAEAPPKSEPGHAFFLRRQAGAGCALLYSLVCNVVSSDAVVIPGGIKAVPRMVFKTMVNYAGDFSRCKDVVRATVKVGSLRAVAETVGRLFDTETIKIVRMKDRFQPDYDSGPTGGYRDVQLLCVFNIDGRWQYGEIQVNVATLVEIKSRPDGGHTVFKYARSFEGYSEATYTFAGSLSEAVCKAVAAGLLINVDLQRDQKATPELWSELWKALKSPRCRVASLNLHTNKLGPEGGKAIGEALKVNKTITDINLYNNRLGPESGKAIAEALKVNRSITNINLLQNNLGAEGGKAVAGALKVNRSVTNINLERNELGTEGGKAIAEALKVNTSITNINLTSNQLGPEGGKAIGEALKINQSVANINLKYNKLGAEGGEAIGEALEVNTSITNIDLESNNLGPEGGKAIGEALKVNRSITNINLQSNELDAEAGKAIGGALKVNTSITNIDLGSNDLDADIKTAIKAAWGDRGGNLSF